MKNKMLSVFLAMLMVTSLLVVNVVAGTVLTTTITKNSLSEETISISPYNLALTGLAPAGASSSATAENGVFTFVSAPHTAQQSAGLIFNKYRERMPTGVFTIDMDVTFTNPETSDMRVEGKRYVSSSLGWFDVMPYCMQNGKFFEGIEGKEFACESGVTYDITLEYNINDDAITWTVANADKDINVSNSWFSDKLQGLDILSIYFYTDANSETTATFVAKNITLKFDELEPIVSKTEYIKGSDEVIRDDWSEGKVPASADSVRLTFKGNTALINTASNAATLYKVVGDNKIAVNTTEVFNDTYDHNAATDSLIITPVGGFDSGASYEIYLSNLKTSIWKDCLGTATNETPICFETTEIPKIVSPSKNEIVSGASATLKATVPQPEKGVKFYVDGEEVIATADDNDTNLYVATATELPYGKHIFKVVSGNELVSETFYTANFSTVGELEYSDLGTAASQCAGSDGTENGGIQISGETTRISCPASFATGTDMFYFEADVKRVDNDGIIISGKGTNKSSANNWPYLVGGADSAGDLALVTRLGYKVNTTAGAILGNTNYVLPSGEDAAWNKLVAVQELRQGDAYIHVFLNGEHIITEKVWADTSTFNTLSNFAIKNNGSSLQLDNVRYGIINSPLYIDAQYTEDEITYLNAVDGVISGISKAIKITQLNNPLTMDGVEVTVNGVAATAVIDSTDANSLIITPADGSINANENVVIKVGNYVTVLKADGDTLDKIGAVKAEFAGAGASARVTIAKATVGVSALDKVTLIVASYDGNKLKAIDLRQITLDSGSHEYSTSIEDLNGGTKVRAMLWGGLSALDPISFDEVTVSEN